MVSRLRRLARPAPRRWVVLLSNNKLLKAADGPGATASGACVALAASALLRGWERCWLLAKVCGSGKQLLQDCRRDLPSAHAGPGATGMPGHAGSVGGLQRAEQLVGGCKPPRYRAHGLASRTKRWRPPLSVTTEHQEPHGWLSRSQAQRLVTLFTPVQPEGRILEEPVPPRASVTCSGATEGNGARWAHGQWQHRGRRRRGAKWPRLQPACQAWKHTPSTDSPYRPGRVSASVHRPPMLALPPGLRPAHRLETTLGDRPLSNRAPAKDQGCCHHSSAARRGLKPAFVANS